jgi:hypothetical protein
VNDEGAVQDSRYIIITKDSYTTMGGYFPPNLTISRDIINYHISRQ